MLIRMRPVLVLAIGIGLARPLAWVARADALLTETGSKLVAIPPGKDSDIKLYGTYGHVAKGEAALAEMLRADLVLWMAGNQFFAMDEVIGRFRKENPDLRIGLITLPPGLILQAIKAGGWTFGATRAELRPDIYASVNLGHLKDLKAAGLMDQFRSYMHNELQIMVAKGNPKRIAGIGDLVRADVRTSSPNPVNEGIMQFYARKVLERHGIWDRLSGGNECVSCQTTPGNWFTEVHHRETPDRIARDLSDAGIVWKTEVLEALRDGAQVSAVELPPEDSLRDEVAYVIGVLRGNPHQRAADAFVSYLASPAGQEAYAKFGFVSATPDELKPKPIP